MHWVKTTYILALCFYCFLLDAKNDNTAEFQDGKMLTLCPDCHYVAVSSVCVLLYVCRWVKDEGEGSFVACEDHCVSSLIIGYIVMTLRLLSILWNAKGQISILMCYPPAF